MNVTDRFLRYVALDTHSDPHSGKHPSNPDIAKLASELALELDLLGLEDISVSDKCYVTGWLKASEGCEDMPSIGLIAHMDTSPDCSSANVQARIIEYKGEDIVLNEKKNIIMRVSEFEHLNNYVGKHLIVTDGTTLLGADDKAGIAEILTALEILTNDRSIKHGRIPVCFTPDEEIGEGTDFFDVAGFNADFAYTVDGGALGELEYENFNAASAEVKINGVNIHPGDAKNKMKNASLLAVELASLLPADQTPASTEGYEGFFHLAELQGDEENARLSYIIRDHDREKFEKRKQLMSAVVRFMNDKHGENTVVLDMHDSYYNMREIIEKDMSVVERAADAMEKVGVQPVVRAIRGGTDGARLSFMGLPCPNLFTGGHNFHGRFEYICIESMESMVGVLVELVRC